MALGVTLTFEFIQKWFEFGKLGGVVVTLSNPFLNVYPPSSAGGHELLMPVVIQQPESFSLSFPAEPFPLYTAPSRKLLPVRD